MAVLAQYLYGVVRTVQSALDLGAIGIGGSPVHAIADGDVSVVASAMVERGPVRLLRQNLASHHRVLVALMQSQSVIPFTFGHVVESPAALTRFMRTHRERLAQLLDRVEGCVEMGLKISWHTGDPFAHVVACHPELARHREEVFGAPGAGAGAGAGESGPSRDAKIALGRHFESCLTQERQTHQERVLAALKGRFKEVAARPPRNESTLVDLAVLVPRDARASLEEAVDKHAGSLGDQYLVEWIGPFAPHSFTRFDEEG